MIIYHTRCLNGKSVSGDVGWAVKKIPVDKQSAHRTRVFATGRDILYYPTNGDGQYGSEVFYQLEFLEIMDRTEIQLDQT